MGGSTPYNAVYGRVPRMLPSIDQISAPGEVNEPNPRTLASTHRLREISIQAMVEGSARARLGRALNTRSTISAQKINLKIGEEVDIYRAPNNKDTPAGKAQPWSSTPRVPTAGNQRETQLPRHGGAAFTCQETPPLHGALQSWFHGWRFIDRSPRTLLPQCS